MLIGNNTGVTNKYVFLLFVKLNTHTRNTIRSSRNISKNVQQCHQVNFLYLVFRDPLYQIKNANKKTQFFRCFCIFSFVCTFQVSF